MFLFVAPWFCFPIVTPERCLHPVLLSRKACLKKIKILAASLLGGNTEEIGCEILAACLECGKPSTA
jgi:hypothetical protein